MAVTLIDTFSTCGTVVSVYIDTATLQITYDPSWVYAPCDPGDRGNYLIDTICQDGTDNAVTIITSEFTPYAVVSNIDPGNSSCAIASCTPETVSATKSDESASGADDGVITIAATNLLGEPRTYSIDDGSTFQASNVFAALPPGNYQIKVKYGSVCVKAGPVITINEGACSLVVNQVQPTDATTNGGSDGQISFTVSGGSTPYQYSTDNGASFGSINPVTGLSAGSYQWIVEDDDGCRVSGVSVIGEPAAVISAPFDPDLIISDLIPYQFQLNYASGAISKELYNAEQIPGLNNVCFHQAIGCNDNITLQFSWVDGVYGTTPRIRIRNWHTNALEGTITTFTNVTDDLYSLTLPALAYCGKTIYLQIISYDGSTEHYVHATSGSILVQEPYFDSVHITYSDNKDLGEIGYEDTGYFNEIRIQGNFYEQDNPQTDAIHQLSDGAQVKLKSTLKRTKKLNIYRVPDFLHEKIQGALGHDNVTIGGIRYIKDSEYQKDTFQYRQRTRNANVSLLEKETFYQENIL